MTLADREALFVIALKDAMLNATAEFEIARALRLEKTERAKKNVLQHIRVCLRQHSLSLLRKSDLNPNAPVWIPQALRRPKMRRYHPVTNPAQTHGLLCAQQ